jgi:Tol biopolymer transport system component
MINSLLEEKTVQPIATFNSKNTTGIVFIDPKVDDYEILMAGVTPNLEVVLLDENQDGIGQITEVLKVRSGLSSLHLVAHGEAGSLWLGNNLVDSKILDQQKDDLQSWKAALATDADILIYGCQVAEGKKGQQFVQLLGELTGADVAASRNLTGSAALGGDWELEVKIGNVEAPIAFDAGTLEAYNAVLTTTRVSVASDGTQGNFNSLFPSISADGRYVAFSSAASNLVSGDTNNATDVFVYDTVANTTRRVSLSSDGTQGNNDSWTSSISADGRYVAFMSSASNLVSGNTNGFSDIFVYDTVTNTTRRVSVSNDGTQGNGNSYSPSVSADGRYVAFMSSASNLVSGDTNGATDIFVYDTVSNTTRRVSVASEGTQAYDFSYSPSISADGRYVSFDSDASNLVSGDTNNARDVFLYDTVTNTTRRVSISSDGIEGNSTSYSPSISADGRYVSFDSDASNLVSGDTNNARDVFLYDTVTNTTRRVSVASDGTQANGDSSISLISADGRYVAFYSAASNLVSGDTNGAADTFIYDTVTNTIRRVSVASDGTQGNRDSYAVGVSISTDGNRVAFVSLADNLVSGDTNDSFDIFLYDSNSETQNTWTGTPGDDTYTYTGTADFTGNGLAGNDTIVGGIGNDYILGGAGNDWVWGGLGNDIINGNEGNDFVYGGRNHDFLIGEDGSDYLWGGFGNDLLVGYGLGFTNSDIDTLVGGRGADTFSIGLNFTYFGGTGMIPTYASNGDADYALIQDFTTRDVIELYGSIDQYTFSSANVVGSATPDTLIYWKVENTLELVAVVQDVTNVPVNNLVFFT